MIKDVLKNSELYYPLADRLETAFEWLRAQDLEEIECKRHPIDGNNIYANVESYITKNDANFEAHRKYIDIQYMIKGKELIGVTDISNCKVCKEYTDDIEFFSCEKFDYQVLNEGDYLILFPTDAHKPCIKSGDNAQVKKVVVKVKI